MAGDVPEEPSPAAQRAIVTPSLASAGVWVRWGILFALWAVVTTLLVLNVIS